MLPLFAITIFLGAALLFLVQPMGAKQVLPLLGGSPAVWNGCMLFFQAALLGGYCLAHGLGKLAPRLQGAIYAALLAIPIVGSIALGRLVIGAPPADPSAAGGPPVFWLLMALGLMAGTPFVIVAAAGPLLQRWFSGTRHSAAKDPYFLYAASNAGSMVGLLGYPFLVEPWLTLTEQRRLWSVAFLVFAVLVTGCAVALRLRAGSVGPEHTVPAGPPIARRQRALWLALALIPSSLTLGVTQHISTDIAAVPLLWVLPLAVYLATFIIAFSRRRMPVVFISRMLPLVVAGVAIVMLLGIRTPVGVITTLHLLGLFFCALLCHTRLALARPGPAHLTEFYLLIAAGGVLGGIFNAIVAPQVFNSLVEYPLAIVLALLFRIRAAAPESRGTTLALSIAAPSAVALFLVAFAWIGPAIGLNDPVLSQAVWIGVPVVVCLAVSRAPAPFALATGAMLAVALHLGNARTANLELTRTFFGILRLSREGDMVTLIHNTTTHGLQDRSEAKRRTPIGYYHPSSPIGQVFQTFNASPLFDRIGVLGLGTGALAAYGRPRQELTFHEIDPAVARIAQNPGYFTYLTDSAAKYQIIIGDGRLTMSRAPDESYGLIVLDAFSSDSIPIHLLTREATAVYFSKLAPHGIIAFHISNHFLDLAPVLHRIAGSLGVSMLYRKDDFTPEEEAARAEEGIFSSSWVLLARDASDFGPLAADPRWHSKTRTNGPLWTDDYSNILSVFQWD